MPWSLHTLASEQKEQFSFLGGRPRLPADCLWPVCDLCHSQQTFFFQLAVPNGEFWEGNTVAAFACTKCAHEDYLIPPMLPRPLKGADIPENFLEEYQRNFSFMVFPTKHGVDRTDHNASVQFSEIQMKREDETGNFGKLGGSPDWLLEDESPKTYSGKIPMKFLVEIAPNVVFRRTVHSEPQVELDLLGNPSPSPLDCYQLFLGNALYLFGTDGGRPEVYALTQV
jgi:hypothetical protein